MSPLADELPPIFLSRKPAAHRGKLCLGEGHSSTTTIPWYFRKPLSDATWLGPDLDEAGFGARGNLAGKLYSVTHWLVLKAAPFGSSSHFIARRPVPIANCGAKNSDEWQQD